MADLSVTNTPADYSLPRFALIGGAVLIAASLLLAVTGRFADLGTLRMGDVPLVASKSLSFVNGADGGVTIRDGKDGHVVRLVPPGTDGFIWGAVNGLSRGRKLVGLDLAAPYTLARRSDGHLVLKDPTTEQSIILEGFGHGNAAVFARLLDEREGVQ